jgi:hypothetical protein
VLQRYMLCFGRAVSSVGEHFLDMEGVTGSNPVPPTSFFGTTSSSVASKAATGRTAICALS